MEGLIMTALGRWFILWRKRKVAVSLHGKNKNRAANRR
jgi:hypothetical protein